MKSDLQDLLRKIGLAAVTLWEEPCTERHLQMFYLSAQSLCLQTVVQSKLLKGFERLGGLSGIYLNRPIQAMIHFAFGDIITLSLDRQIALRRLGHHAIVLCALAYTVDDIMAMPPVFFNFLLRHVEHFIQVRKLSNRLCNVDISAALTSCTINMRTDDRDRLYSIVNVAEPFTGPASHIPVTGEMLPDNMFPKVWNTEAVISTLDTVLCPILAEAIRQSQHYKKERENEMSRTTECVSITIPGDFRRDAFISLWVDREQAFQIRNYLDMQYAEILPATEYPPSPYGSY
ncbi:hypothetical protein FHL15_007163 [Xylaria flabelliformis]|uniref:Uncharacterized protein n=1 Tax=Xylaria flabelliformis TaxID=2512241 RepID=A0A553HV64_9PEZI|nr:hypothetical protein FHL15_007163 [Xylaria flabelliformis]